MKPMLRYLLFTAVSLAACFFPGKARAGVNSIEGGNRVLVATGTANPTLILSPDQQRQGLVIANYNTDATHFVLVDESSTSFSNSASTGTSRIGPNSSFSPDGIFSPYTGGLYAVSLGSTALAVDLFPVK